MGGRTYSPSSSISKLNFSTGVPRPDSFPFKLLNIILGLLVLDRLVLGGASLETDETVEDRPLLATGEVLSSGVTFRVAGNDSEDLRANRGTGNKFLEGRPSLEDLLE
jgi:hypothetical protein